MASPCMRRATHAFALVPGRSFSATGAQTFGRPVGVALYGRLNRKSVGSPEAMPLRSAPHTSGIVNIQMIMGYSRYCIRSAAEQLRHTNA
eukprot:4529858-Pleurochrysis_carterae.AAC.1